MRKLVALMLCIVMATSTHASTIDWASMSDEELYYELTAGIEEYEKRTAAETESEEVQEEPAAYNDFFDQYDDASELQRMVRTQEISQFYDLVVDYIENTNPKSSDSAFELKEVMEPIVSDWESFTIVSDSFKDATYVYYGDIKEITDDVHFVPRYAAGSSVPGEGFQITMGFYADDWLFFDEVNFYGGYYVIDDGTSKKIQDVIKGKGIYEALTYYYYEDSFDDEDWDPEGLTAIQFENDEHETLEFELSDEEREAFDKMQAYASMEETLFNIINRKLPYKYTSK